MASTGLALVDDVTAGFAAVNRRLGAIKQQDVLVQRGDLVLAVPSYFWPDDTWTTGDRRWRRMAASGARLTVANPNSGPGTTTDANFTRAIDENHARGVVTLGYVRTDYGRFTAAAIKADIDRWFTLYPDIDGIFFDEADNGLGQTGGLADPPAFYSDLVAHVRAKNPRYLTVINPGTDLQTAAMCEVADLSMTFEHDAAAYLAKTSVPDFARTGTTKHWHCVYAATADQLPAIVAKARELGAHALYVTDDVLGTDGNPYDSLPPSAYLDAVTGRASAATPTGSGSTDSGVTAAEMTL